MSVLLVIATAYLACRIVPRLLVELVATVIGILLVVADRRVRRTLLEGPWRERTALRDHKPSRAERKALRRGLDAALDLTEFTSLFPHIAIRANKFTRA